MLQRVGEADRTAEIMYDEERAFQLHLTQEAFEVPGQRRRTIVRVRSLVGPAKPEMIDGNDPPIRRETGNEPSVRERRDGRAMHHHNR